MAYLKLAYISLSFIGLCASIYSVHVEHSKLEDSKYSAYCDIDESISCSAVLTSKQSIGFGLVGYLLGDEHVLNQPNSYYGVIFYPFQFILGLISIREVQYVKIVINIIVCCISTYLIYILMFVLHKICIVCMTIHFINFCLLIFSFLSLNHIKTKTE